MGLSFILMVLSFVFPSLNSSNYHEKSLSHLRERAKSIKAEFAGILSEIQRQIIAVSNSKATGTKENLFALMKSVCPDPETYGIGYYDRYGKLVLWYGQVIDLQRSLFLQGADGFLKDDESTYLVHEKASVFLIMRHKTDDNSYMVFYRLLAFLPQFKAYYLKERHFLSDNLLENCSISYQDFREDVSGFESLFAIHEDEYIGKPSLQDEILTIFFPLRTQDNNLIATVTLRSPPLLSKLTSQKEDIMLIFYLFIVISFLCLFMHLAKTFLRAGNQKPFAIFIVVSLLTGLRAFLFSLSRLERIRSSPIFSSASASFISLWELTQSPADIFFTSLTLFLITGYLALHLQRFLKKKKYPPSLKRTFVASLIFIPLCLALIFAFQQLLSRLVFNTSINLLQISSDPSLFLLHLSILLFFFCFALTCFLGIKFALLFSKNLFPPMLVLLAGLMAYSILFWKILSPLILASQGLILVFLLATAASSRLQAKRFALCGLSLFSLLLIYCSTYGAITRKNHSRLQNSLMNTILTQEQWASFLLEQAFPEIDKREESIVSLLQAPKPSDLAKNLWEKTLIAKFSWYSSLEIIDSAGAVLSSFSLNIPEAFQLDTELPLNDNWSLAYRNISYFGKERDFITAHKDWIKEGNHLGKTVIYLSIDYEMLPFLYSANPYSELMRMVSFPSLSHTDFGFSVFDKFGKLVFNPNHISSGIPKKLLQKIHSSTNPLWLGFDDRGEKFHGLFFKNKNRIYSLLLPQKSFFKHGVEFLVIFFLYSACIVLTVFLYSILAGKRKWKNPLWSFSNRVYISFIAIAVVPLFLFTFSTQSFIQQFFTQKTTEETEAEATFAQKVMEDFIFLEQQEQVSLTIPPDNMVLWISTTISNDVDLYMDGRLASSSHREFFEYGLLPDLINGEAYYRMQYENNPFYTQTQKIGDYSFQTLTIPYYFQEALLLISLPFPSEKQEISKNMTDFVEFLFLTSCLFILVVLLFARGIGGMIITPIQKLLTGTREVSLGNLEVAIPHKHQDEMKVLIEGFNAMVINLKKYQQELADLSKKVAWAEMARKVAHEVKNPLTPIQLSAEHLLKVYEEKPESFKQALKESTSYIVKEVENLRAIAQQFLENSREGLKRKENLDLREIVSETIESYQKVLSERIQFRMDYTGKNFQFTGDSDKIKIVIRNILTNAIESIPKTGRITIRMTATDNNLQLEIIDTGHGIDRQMLSRVFDPYFSTKDAGTGLGLPIAKKIIEEHNGSIQALPNEPHGIRILIRLPRLKT